MPSTPYKFRDKRTNEIIEFNWDGPGAPTKADIDKIVATKEAKFNAPPAAKPRPIPVPDEPVQLKPSVLTPRFTAPNPLESFKKNVATAPNAVRFGSSLAGQALAPFTFGTSPFIGGAGGEGIARYMEGKDFDPEIMAVEGALNYIPGMGELPGKGATLKELAKFAAKSTLAGTTQGILGSAARHQADKGNLTSPSKWELPPLEDMAGQGAMGGAIGLGGGVIGGALARKYGAEPKPAGTGKGYLTKDEIKGPKLNAAEELAAARKAEAELPSPTNDITETPDVKTPTQKPRYRLILDADGKTTGVKVLPPFPAAETGAGLGITPDRIESPVSAPSPKLPKNLAGARPRYGIGNQSYEPIFDNDIDKSLFIIAKENKSKSHEGYVQFIKDATGMDETTARVEGMKIRGQLKDILKGQPLGENKIPKLYNPPTDIQPMSGMKQVDIVQQQGPTAEQIRQAEKIITKHEGSTERLLDMTPQDKIEYAEAIKPGAFPHLSEANAHAAQSKTTSIVTGNEAAPVPPIIEKAAVETKPSASGIAPSAQAEQSINEFVPKNADEAYSMLTSAEKRMRAIEKDPKKFEVKFKKFASEFMNFPKHSWASMDMSGALRQGKGLIYRKEFWTSLDDMFKSAWSDDEFAKVQDRIKNKEYFSIMMKDVKGTKPFNPGLVGFDKEGIRSTEEAFLGNWLEEIPSAKSTISAIANLDKTRLKPSLISRWAKASERGYIGFLNTLRADTHENIVKGWVRAGKDPFNNPDLMKQLGEFISSSTGRGDLGSFEKALPTLNAWGFAPKFAKSRFDLAFGKFLLQPGMKKEIRYEAAKSYLGMMGYWAAMAGTAELAGYRTDGDWKNAVKIELNPVSSDFGKIQIGNVRIDTLGGVQQPFVVSAKIISGLSQSPTTEQLSDLTNPKYGGQTGLDVGTNFVRTKLSPYAGLAWDRFLTGKTPTGQNTKEEIARLDRQNYLVKMYAPNMITSIMDIYEADPKAMMDLGIPYSNLFTPSGKRIPIPVVMTKAGLIGASYFGEGVQVFGDPVPPKNKSPYGSGSKSPYGTSSKY